MTENLIKSLRSAPHRLLYILVRDFDLNAQTLLEGSVTVQGQGFTEEAVLFKTGTFRVWLEEMESVLRDLEAFNRKNTNFSYDFHRLKEEFVKRDTIPVDSQNGTLLQIIHKSNKAMRNIAFNLKLVADNHYQAVGSENSDSVKEKLVRTKDLPIEQLEMGMRYIPNVDRIIVSNNRLNNKNLLQAMEELTANLFNYLFIFRDSEVVDMMASSRQIEADIAATMEELKRMGESV